SMTCVRTAIAYTIWQPTQLIAYALGSLLPNSGRNCGERRTHGLSVRVPYLTRTFFPTKNHVIFMTVTWLAYLFTPVGSMKPILNQQNYLHHEEITSHFNPSATNRHVEHQPIDGATSAATGVSQRSPGSSGRI